MITVTDVDLSFNETFTWIFSGLNVNISRCDISSVRLAVQSNNTEQLVENTVITIHNSSFRSLDLKPGTKAQITDCYIDAQFKSRPTLITANNSGISIQNCHFGNFINENGSTILYGHYYSHVIIENLVIIGHSSSKSVIFLENDSSIHITSSLISLNVASIPFYSTITLKDRINAVVKNTLFRNNSALVGGALIAENHCNITLSNCTFSSNKGITGKTVVISTSNVEMPVIDNNKMGTYFFINPSLFNQASSRDKNPEVIAPHPVLHVKSFTLNNRSSKKEEDLLHSVGGAIYVAIQSRLFVINCVFENNSAQYAGAISATQNVIVEIQKTNFTGNSAFEGGAIHADTATYLRTTESRFENNRAEKAGGAIAGGIDAVLKINRSYFLENSASFSAAIIATINVTLDIQETTFLCNKAFTDLGAIDVQHQANLRIKNCSFDNNMSQRYGGAICGGFNATVEIQDTKFTCNKADQGGAIDVDQHSFLRITNCTFEDNHAQLGGALFGGLDLVCEINDSHFLNNIASKQGGALNIQQKANLLITNCKFECNSAIDLAGGIAVATNVKSKILKTYFTGNSAPNGGGALVVASQTECHVEWCIFHNNTAKAVGGAVGMSETSSLKIGNTNFTNNNSTDGGAIYIDSNSKLQTIMCSYWKNVAQQTGGAIKLIGNATAVIKSCHFLSNHAEKGGAIDIYDMDYLYIGGTFLLRNVATGRGGAVAMNGANNVTINNITCVGNRSPRGGCLCISFVELTLTKSNISENFGHLYAAGIAADFSRIQVGNETRSMSTHLS